MVQQVLRFLRRLLTSCQVCGACKKLMPVGQNSARDERRIFELWVDAERQINTLGNMIDDPVGDEHLHADLWVGRLERPNKRREKRI